MVAIHNETSKQQLHLTGSDTNLNTKHTVKHAIEVTKQTPYMSFQKIKTFKPKNNN